MSKRRAHRPDRPAGRHPTRAHLAGDGGGPLDADRRVAALLDRMDRHGLAWRDVADDVLPIFERARPFASDVEPPAHAVVPPGVTIGFGIDLGLAFARVAAVHLDAWPIDMAELTRRALRNLRRRARQAREYDLVREPVGVFPPSPSSPATVGHRPRSWCPRRSSASSARDPPCSSHRHATC